MTAERPGRRALFERLAPKFTSVEKTTTNKPLTRDLTGFEQFGIASAIVAAAIIALRAIRPPQRRPKEDKPPEMTSATTTPPTSPEQRSRRIPSGYYGGVTPLFIHDEPEKEDLFVGPEKVITDGENGETVVVEEGDTNVTVEETVEVVEGDNGDVEEVNTETEVIEDTDSGDDGGDD